MEGKKNRNGHMKIKNLIVFFLVCVIAVCFAGCRPASVFVPDDALNVKWNYKWFPGQQSTFFYNNVEYELMDGIWRIDWSATEPIGSLLLLGPAGCDAPMVLFGIPVLSNYVNAESCVSEGGELKFIGTVYSIWLDSRIDLNDKENVLFNRIHLNKPGESDDEDSDIVFDDAFAFGDIIDVTNVIDSPEEVTMSCYIEVFPQEVEGLYCFIDFVNIDGSFYTPLEMCGDANFTEQQFVLLTDEWQEIISGLVAKN